MLRVAGKPELKTEPTASRVARTPPLTRQLPSPGLRKFFIDSLGKMQIKKQRGGALASEGINKSIEKFSILYKSIKQFQKVSGVTQKAGAGN